MLGWELPPYNSGGLGVACFGLSRALARSGARITFVLPKKIPVTLDFAELLFADEREISSVDELFSAYASGTARLKLPGLEGIPDARGSLLEEVFRYALRARERLKDRTFDCIHAHDWLSFPAGLALKRATGKPLVVHVHATEFDRTGGQGANAAVYAIERAGMMAADRVIAVSGKTKNILVERYGIPEDKIHVVHNGIDKEDWGHNEDPVFALEGFKRRGYRVIVFVGRITIQKGPDYFLRLAAQVVRLRPKTMFVFAGSGDMQEQMIREASERGIAHNILFAGFVRDGALAGLYRAADALVMPSVSEPYGITALEAMMHGTPVLVSKQAGVSESSGHMLTADFWDVDEMTDKIIALLDHWPLAQTLSENGTQDVQRINWAEAARKCLDVYREALTPAVLG